jgi:mitochondrial inner membrane protease subunit 2
MSRFLPKLTLSTPETLLLTSTLTLSYIYTTQLLSLHRITGSSMSPTLSPTYSTTRRTDWVLLRQHTFSPLYFLSALNPFGTTSEARPHVRAGLERGDVVALRKPHDPAGAAIKRVIALGGDRVTRHSVSRRREWETGIGKDLGLGPVADELVVPRNHVWVESDNPDIKTVDSNVFGPIHVAMVIGKVERIVWPVERMGPVGERPRRRKGEDTTVVKRVSNHKRDVDAWIS